MCLLWKGDFDCVAIHYRVEVESVRSQSINCCLNSLCYQNSTHYSVYFLYVHVM